MCVLCMCVFSRTGFRQIMECWRSAAWIWPTSACTSVWQRTSTAESSPTLSSESSVSLNFYNCFQWSRSHVIAVLDVKDTYILMINVKSYSTRCDTSQPGGGLKIERLKVHIWGHISYTHSCIGRTFASWITKIILQKHFSLNALFFNYCFFFLFYCMNSYWH